jgi:hypothetical protein
MFAAALTPSEPKATVVSYIEPGTPRYCGSQGSEANMLKQSRTVDALRAQHRQRASAARIAWHTLTRKGLAKLPPAKPQP